MHSSELDQRSFMVPNEGRSTTLFDSRGLTRAEQDPLGAYTSLSHDPVGNTVLRVDARSWAITYTMDALNRTAQELYVDRTRVTNSWDVAGLSLPLHLARSSPLRRSCYRNAQATREEVMAATVPFGGWFGGAGRWWASPCLST